MRLDDPLKSGTALIRKRMRFGTRIAPSLLAAATLTAPTRASQTDLKLTYDKPAEKWTEALPLLM